MLKVDLPHSLDKVGQFSFGERYLISLLTGASIEVSHLDTLLDVIKSEFMLAETYDLTLHMSGGKQKSLVLRPQSELGRPWNRNINKTCQQIFDWVTIYNLSGEWPADAIGLTVNPTWRK